MLPAQGWVVFEERSGSQSYQLRSEKQFLSVLWINVEHARQNEGGKRILTVRLWGPEGLLDLAKGLGTPPDVAHHFHLLEFCPCLLQHERIARDL